MTKRRYSLKTVAIWVIALNGILGGLGLVLIYYVKTPYQTLNLPAFHLSRWIWRILFGMVVQTIVYFFALNTYYRLLTKRARWQKYLLPSTALLALCVVFYILNDLTIERQEFTVAIDISVKVFNYGLGCFFELGLPLLIAAVTRQLDEKRGQAQKQKTLEQRTFQLEKEKMQADYLFLKAQVNPHFLHNTLNFLYSRALPCSPELSEGILILSQIMRYALEMEEDADGKVLLSREIEHLSHVIRIQELRFPNNLQLAFTVRGDPGTHRVLPFVLITLAENAFKHGDLKNAETPIKLELDISEDGHLRFFCSNKKKSGPRELSTGIGLDNTRKRLELAYGMNYSLYIKDQREAFTVDLVITL